MATGYSLREGVDCWLCLHLTNLKHCELGKYKKFWTSILLYLMRIRHLKKVRAPPSTLGLTVVPKFELLLSQLRCTKILSRSSTFWLTQGLVKKERYFVSEIFTFIFDMERVLLQPANSLLKPAKKVRI